MENTIKAELRREQKRKAQAEWRKRNPTYLKEWAQAHYGPHRPRYQAYARKQRLRKEYNLTLADYDAMLTAQGGVCAICNKPPKKYRLSVDHSHTTGAVRGLLCVGCNVKLGAIENPTFMATAQTYLEKFNVG